MRWALSCLVLIGCGRIGFGSSADAPAAPPEPPEPLELVIGPFATTSTEFVDVPGATLTIPPSPGTTWLLVTTATLASTNIVPFSVEARYLVDGVERGLGGSQGLGAGPWQHFYVLDGTDAAQPITYQLRDASAGTATIDQLHAVALPLPAGAEPRYASVDAPQLVSATAPTPVAQLSLGALAGEYVVLVLVNSSDDPGQSDVYVEWLGPGGEVLVERAQNSREPWQSTFMVRVLSLETSDAVFTLRSEVGGGSAQVAYVRVLALRTDAFASLDHQLSTTPVDVATDVRTLATQLVPAGSAERYFYLASSWSEDDCANIEPALRRLHFVVGEEDRVIEHATANCALQLTYGSTGLLDVRPDLLATGISSGNGQHAILGDSQIVLLGLP